MIIYACLVTALGLAVSIPLYICEANLGGVELIHHLTKRLQSARVGTTDSIFPTFTPANNTTESATLNSTAADPRIGNGCFTAYDLEGLSPFSQSLPNQSIALFNREVIVKITRHLYTLHKKRRTK